MVIMVCCVVHAGRVWSRRRVHLGNRMDECGWGALLVFNKLKIVCCGGGGGGVSDGVGSGSSVAAGG